MKKIPCTVAIPEGFHAPEKQRPILYTHHARQRAKERKIEARKLPDTFDPVRWQLVEICLDDSGRVQYYLFQEYRYYSRNEKLTMRVAVSSSGREFVAVTVYLRRQNERPVNRRKSRKCFASGY